MANEDMKRYSLKEIEDMITRGDYTPTRKDAAEYSVDPEFWKTARIVQPKTKKSVHLKVEEDVLNWFKAQGPGHITRMQAVLKSFYEAQSH